MTTRMIFVRHGESEGNLNHCFIGQGDVALTERGHAQAQAVGQYLKDMSIDAFYASDLRRAYETAGHIAAFHKASVTAEIALREIFAGAWEGRPFEELERCYPTAYGAWIHDIGRTQCTEGERVTALYERVNRFALSLAKKHMGQTVLCATHATPIRALMCHWHGIAPEDMKAIPWTKNASVTIAEYHENGAVDIIKEGDVSFMTEDLVTYLPNNV